MADNSGKGKTSNTKEVSGISRRKVLRSAVSATSASLIPLASTSCTTPIQTSALVLSDEAQTLLEFFVDRLIPADENGPGAVAAGVPNYINNTLADWNSAELETLTEGLLMLSRTAAVRYGREFPILSESNKDALLMDMEDGNIEGFENSSQVFSRLHRLTLEGMFSDPYYGGNYNYAGWDLIGYPGAVMASSPDMQRMGGKLPSLHTSAYGSDYDGE